MEQARQAELDAVKLLTSQHREMEGLLQQVADSHGDDTTKNLFAQIADQLTVHLKAEEEIFYPAVHEACTEDDLLESLEEHLSLKRLLADLIELEPADKTFEPKFKVLKEQTEHHHREEEEHLFPEVLKLLDAERRMALGKAILARQFELAKKGEPRGAVSNETISAAPLQ
ncbi:MAG TPA: hemerythrin domain-containing protein [Noviherbaspirillum sp.]|nr:hemerythrin domain-containing protein [Noviherbaspirillum sp.]